MKRAIAIGTWVAIASLSACENHAGSSSAVFGDDAGRVTLSTSDPLLTLSRGGQQLLSFPLDAFQLGVIVHVDPMISYDPYFVAQGMTNPSSLHFLSPTSASLAVDGASLQLSYEEGWSARVSVHPDAAGSLSVTFAPTTARRTTA